MVERKGEEGQRQRENLKQAPWSVQSAMWGDGICKTKCFPGLSRHCDGGEATIGGMNMSASNKCDEENTSGPASEG